MTTNSFHKSDLPGIFNIVQNTMIKYPKELVIDILRKFYSYDTYYRYVSDEFGFPKIVKQNNLALDAGMEDNLCTRINITEYFNKNDAFYPCILVKNNSAKSVNFSAPREDGTILTEKILYEDGYGNQKLVNVPIAHELHGRWDGSLSIEILAMDLDTRDELVELTALALLDIYFRDLEEAGVVIKPPTIGSPSEVDNRKDKIYKQVITIDYIGEWRREIPIENIIERILFTIEFQNLDNPNSQPAPNLTVIADINIVDAILNLP
jgi:hypothetical protein